MDRFWILNQNGVTDADNPAIANAPFLGVGSKDGFTCTISSNSSCNLWVAPLDGSTVDGGKQFMKIKAPRNLGQGDIGIEREFVASENEHYAATATVSVIDVTESGGENQLYARLTIAATTGTAQLSECNSFLKISKDTADSPAEVLEVPDCQLPNDPDVAEVHIKARLHSSNLNSGATLILHDLNFRRTQ